MSFWSTFPGPYWSHWFQSVFSCAPQDEGMLSNTHDKLARWIPLPSGTRVQELTDLNAKEIELLLKYHYQTFPRAKLFLSETRIREGFVYDNWIGVGVYTGLKLIGCVISRELGTITVNGNDMPRVGLVDFFCVETSWRKKGLASLLLQEFVITCAKKKRCIHIFCKEGLPISPLPPIWQSHYIWRKRGLPEESSYSLGKEGISTRSYVRSFTYTSYVPHKGCISSTPSQLTGDSEIYSFSYKGYSMNLCITDTFHRSVPEGWKIGEILWVLPKEETPRNIVELAVEALVDNCKFDIVLMDATIAHSKSKGWQKDSPYGYYIYNYNPAQFFSLKPYFVL